MIDMIQNVASISQAKGLGSMVTDQMSSATQVQGATPGSEAGMTFASVLGDMATEAMNNLKQSEVKSIDGINGKANTREVVDAVLAAEQSLQTAIAFRDKLISAYLDISKMQI